MLKLSKNAKKPFSKNKSRTCAKFVLKADADTSVSLTKNNVKYWLNCKKVVKSLELFFSFSISCINTRIL